MPTIMYVFDPRTREYIISRPAQVVGGKEITKSGTSTTIAPPEIPAGHAARWNGAAWEIVEDHRRKMDDTGTKQGGTPYWLPGDDHNSPERYMDDLGPLPAGAMTERPAAPPPTLEEAVESKLAEILSAYEAAFAPVEAKYPAHEREGWPIQLEEARAVAAAGPGAAYGDIAPTLTAMLAERGLDESMEDFAALIITNNGVYRGVYAALTGQQQRMYRDVQAMAATPGVTADEVEAYPVKYELPGGLS